MRQHADSCGGYADEQILRMEYIAGEPTIILEGEPVRVGTEIHLCRGSEWYRAWIVETELSPIPRVRVVDPRWPGAPLTFRVRELSAVPATRWGGRIAASKAEVGEPVRT